MVGFHSLEIKTNPIIPEGQAIVGSIEDAAVAFIRYPSDPPLHEFKTIPTERGWNLEYTYRPGRLMLLNPEKYVKLKVED